MASKLSEYISFKNGKKSPQNKGKYPIYGGNGILDYCDNYNSNAGIIIGRVGAYCGNVYLSPQPFWASDNAIYAINKENSDLTFDYYLLKFLKLNCRHIGTSQPLLTQEILNNIEYEFPNLNVQVKIATILKSLDNKIMTNNQINKNLEEQAFSIYKEFLNTNEYSLGLLSEIAEITMGQSPSGETYNETGKGSVFFQGRAEFGERFPITKLYTTAPKRKAMENDILMSVRAPVGDINIAIEPCCIGRGLAAIRSKNSHQSFLIYTMKSLKNQLDVFNGEGTVFGSINKDALNNLSIKIPEETIIDNIDEILSPLDLKIKNNFMENLALKNIRDSILPKLMSGEIDVSNLEI